MRPTWSALGQTAAVSVATILGTGILGLPTALYGSGIRPFLFLFLFNLIAQLGVVCATCELLHRNLHSRKSAPPLLSPTPSSSSEGSPITGGSASSDEGGLPPPSLHSLAEQYISARWLRMVFNMLVMAHFIFIMVAYVLAAPQAYAAIFPILVSLPVYVRTTVFLLSLSVVVYFFTQQLLPTLSLATLVKAVLLTVLVALTLDRGLSIRREITTDWGLTKLIDPLLMGTISLAGIVNLMPVTYQTCLRSLSVRRDEIGGGESMDLKTLADGMFLAYYRYASYAAIMVCFGLNIAWVYAVLLVVPQTGAVAVTGEGMGSEIGTDISLEAAAEKGEISTIPLMAVLQASHDRLNGIVAVLVNLFIAISVTISFLVMSVGMLHFVTGSVSGSSGGSGGGSSNNGWWWKRLLASRFVRYWGGGVAIVYIIALCNPQGLLHIMEGVTTLALNLEAGVFIVYMFYAARSKGGGGGGVEQTAEGERDRDADKGFVNRRDAALVVTYLVMYFLVAVLVDVVFYLPSLVFGR